MGDGHSRGATTAQLRDDIDSGRTEDKVCWPDPAAAPRGTDDEAGGFPPSGEKVAQMRAGRSVSDSDARRRVGAGWWFIGLTILIGATLIVAGLGLGA